MTTPTTERPSDGGPAFPVVFQHGHGDRGIKSQEWGGMSLRDWFAGQAIAALISIGATKVKEERNYRDEPYAFPDQPYYFGFWEPDKNESWGVDNLAVDAYMVADAMLAARAKPDESKERQP